MLPQFKSLEWFRIKGKGWAVVVECDQERDRTRPGLEGAEVIIDGERFDCVAVERRVPGSQIALGEKVSLIVRDASQLNAAHDRESLGRDAWNSAIEAAARRIAGDSAELANKIRALKKS